ncbi:tail fiber domain-containing protein [Escherichia coli]|uniref:tail fiber domain-containing protein n=1 Tax=Escherichia coli TaxID=562 RepID=UPI00207B966B|nr:tail fiber domain-containing protein [Escherichia coli]
MTTYATNNPIGSMDPKDLFDNAQNLDFAVNDITKAIWKDRFGRNRNTLWGMEQAFSAQLFTQEQRFNTFIQNSGYDVIGEYTDGPLTISEYNQLIRYQNEFYKLTAATALPFTTTGNNAGSWANDSAHFVSVGDAALRQELLSGPIRSRDNGLALRNIVTVSDFKGHSGFGNDSSSALIAFINHINSGASDDAIYLVDGLYKTTVPLPKITRPVRLVGNGTAHSAILFSDVTNGVSLDLSAMSSGTVHSELARFSILTDKTLAGVGFEFLPNSGDSQSVKLELNSMRVDSLDRFNGAVANGEWLTSIKLGDDTANNKPSEVRINNLVVYGSDLNAKYATLTGSGSSGIVASKATNCIVTNSKIFLLDAWGIKLSGQTEGNQIHFSQVVATRFGVAISGTVNPSNNHCISNTHINPYSIGVKVFPPAGSPSNDTPIACFMDDMFILEREEATNKADGFVGVDLATRFSKLTNIIVWANAKSPGVHTKIGFRIATAGNILVNCHSHRMSYALDTFELITGFAYEVALSEFFEEDSILGFITPTAFKLPAGNARAMSMPGRTWKRPVTWANQFSLIHESGVTYFDVNGGTVALKAPTGDTTQFQHFPSAQTVAGTGLIGVGGSGVAYQGNWILRALLTMFSGSIRPETANSGTCGVAGAPWAGGFTQTAFTVTSDEKFKTAPLEITDAMLDAAAEVNWVQYQYLDRVEVKGADGARWHFGAIAQRYIEAFERHNLDAQRFGFICYDEWEASPDIIDEATGRVVTPAREAGSGYGIRYEEALALEAALQRRNYQRMLALHESLVARIAALEGANHV